MVYSPAQALRTEGRAVVRRALLAARERTLALVAAYEKALGREQMAIDYATTLNPPLWEWAHLAWFQEYWIVRNRQRHLGTRCDSTHERAPSAWQGADLAFDSSRIAHVDRWHLALTSRAVSDYLAGTLQGTLALLDQLPDQACDQALYFFRLCALHEEMHAEAGLYMARPLGIDVSHVPCRKAPAPASTLRIAVGPQSFQLGSDGPGFAFDNELGPHFVDLAAFDIDAEPVSWRRFLDFVRDGGLQSRRWWDEAGWDWLQSEPPARYDGERDLDEAAVHLNAYQAQAWCRWAGRRLPTEAEWECAALTQPGFRWGSVWEWTASTFQPYPGFEAHPYREYSAPWFGTRRVLRGASTGTSASLAHPRYRNFFEPHRSDVFAGFRSCASAPGRLQV